MSGQAKSEENDREQIAELLSRVVADLEFRHAFEADPRAAIASSGIALAPRTVEQLAESANLVPSVAFHTDASDISAIIFFAKNID